MLSKAVYTVFDIALLIPEFCRGVAYSSDTVATGIGAMLLNQAMETEFGKLKATNSLNRDQVLIFFCRAVIVPTKFRTSSSFLWFTVNLLRQQQC